VRFRDQTVVFHVGAHKTGTSLVQKYLTANAAALRRRRIYFLSRTAMSGYVGWGDKLLDDPGPLADRMRKVLRSPWCKVLVASHENTLGRPFVPGGSRLYPRAPELVGALADLLRGYPAKVFVSIRPQADLLESYYLQTIHEGGHEPFAAWLDRIDLDAISWAPLVHDLVDTFGQDRVEVVDFRLISMGQEAYLGHFFSRIDDRYSSLGTGYTTVKNPSVSDKGLQMALAANPELRSNRERRLMRKFLQTHFSNTRYPRPVLLGEERRAWLERRYGGEYEALVETT
jgi:hypothetical protein